jgi:prophage tail gpP-like protein
LINSRRTTFAITYKSDSSSGRAASATNSATPSVAAAFSGHRAGIVVVEEEEEKAVFSDRDISAAGVLAIAEHTLSASQDQIDIDQLQVDYLRESESEEESKEDPESRQERLAQQRKREYTAKIVQRHRRNAAWAACVLVTTVVFAIVLVLLTKN